MGCMADDSTRSFRAVDLRLGVREHLWLAGFWLSVSSATRQGHLCLCTGAAVSLFVCVFRFGRAASVWLCRVLSLATHTHVHPSPTPRSNQSINQMPPSLSLSTAGQQQTVCVLTVHVYYSRGNHTHPVSHSPSFGEAFPTAISPKRPALSLLRALQQCPSRLQPTSRCGPGPAIFLASRPLQVLVLVLVLAAVTNTATVLSFPACQTVPGTSAKCRARIDRL